MTRVGDAWGVRRPLDFILASICVLTPLLLPSTGSADEERPALTSYEAGPLKGAALVVVGETISIDSSRRQQLAKVRVERTLLGDVPVSPLLVVVQGPRPTTPLGAPRKSYFPPPDRGRHVYFLGVREGSLAADFRDAFEADPPGGDVKIVALEQEIALSRIQNEEQRRGETRDYLIKGLTAKSVWVRVHAARELRRFAAVCPSLMRAEDVALIRRLLHGRLPRDQREQLQKLSLRLDRELPSDAAQLRPRREFGVAAWQATFKAAEPEERLTMVGDLFESDGSAQAMARAWWAFDQGEPSVRSHVVRLLGDRRDDRQRKRVRDAYAGEPDPGVRDAIIRAIGRFAAAEDASWLAERAANPRLQRTAWLALARIRTEEALAALRRAHAALEGSATGADRRTATWLAYLLSERFPLADGG